MKIYIRSEGKTLRFWLPTGMIFSKTSAKIANTLGRKFAPDAIEGISPEALETLCVEIGKLKKRYKKWELVKVESADGEIVEILL